MAPLTYPSRVSWQFRNVTREYYFWPTLESISITESNPEDLAVMSGELVDEDADITMGGEDEIWCKVDGVKVFAGHIKSLERTQRSEVGPRTYRFEAQDYTAKLDDSVIDHPRARAAESLADRVAWVMSFLNYPITTGGVDLPSETSERAEYDGMTVREALDQLSDEHRLFYYVDFDKDLHLFRSETVSAPFELDDLAPDYETSFPYTGFGETRDSVELANAAYVIGEKGRTWVTDASSISTFSRQERSINDPELVTATQRTRAGDRANAELSTPQIDGSLLMHEPGLRGGMSFLLTNDLWGFDGVTRIAVSVEMTAVDPHDDDDKAYLHTQVTFSDRRRARPRKHRGAKPTTAALEEGDAVSLERYCYSFRVGRLSLVGAFQYGDLADEEDFAGPDGAIHHTILQNSHAHNIPWTAGVCLLGLGGWGGLAVEEQWFAFTAGDMVGIAGIRFEVTLDDEEGYRTDLVFGVAQDAPSGYRQRAFDEVGRIPAEDGTYECLIPASMIEPGVTNYLMLAAGWDCLPAIGAWECSNDNPDISDVVAAGYAQSGSISVDSVSATELVVAGSGMTDWVSGQGYTDGVNTTYALVGWSGKGQPRARLGAVVQAHPADYTYDADAGTVTFRTAPPRGTNVAFRYTI